MELIGIQNKINDFAKQKGINSMVEIRMIDLTSEVGELSKEVLKGTDYGTKPFGLTAEWKSEIGDILFSLICIANETQVNLEECLNSALEKYETRFNNNGDLSSRR